MRGGPADLDPERLFSPLVLSLGRRVVAAVSGGGDSLALLLLLKDFLYVRDASARLLAVTVDHGLRPESAGEARAVAALCARLGIAHRITAWRGQKPEAGVIAAARTARYDLLARAADEAGADAILTGHTMDDQAETVAMRAARAAGAGLAGMAQATLCDERVWIVRPLLGIRRQALRDFLAGRGIAWVEDPTNEDPSYERARVRAKLADADVEMLAARAREAGRARVALGRQAAVLVERFAARPAPGLFRLDPGLFSNPDAAPAIHALRAVLAMAGGAAHLPDLARAEALFRRLGGGGALRATLSRALVDARRGGVWIRREARNVPESRLAEEPLSWDGRWRVAAPGGRANLSVGPIGAARAKALARKIAGAPESLVRAALSLEPALFAGQEFVAALGAPAAVARGVSARTVAAPFARFLPGFDLALATALDRLAGLPPPPAPPWKHHIDAQA